MKKEKKDKKIAKEKNSKGSRKRRSLSFKEIYTTTLPAAISGRITPLLYIGAIGIILTIATAVIKSTRGVVPFFALLSVVLLAYGTWLRYDVIKKGYNEIVFKIFDYTYLTRFNRRPTGMLLIKYQSEDNSLYHIALSGREDLPPPGWLIRAYIPADAAPAEYGGRKYFSSVFGYMIEGEDDSE